MNPLIGLRFEIRPTLKGNRLRNLFESLSGIGLPCTACAAIAQQGSGSVTIDGKTISLPYARAWVTGHMLEMPSVQGP